MAKPPPAYPAPAVRPIPTHIVASDLVERFAGEDTGRKRTPLGRPCCRRVVEAGTLVILCSGRAAKRRWWPQALLAVPKHRHIGYRTNGELL